MLGTGMGFSMLVPSIGGRAMPLQSKYKPRSVDWDDRSPHGIHTARDHFLNGLSTSRTDYGHSSPDGLGPLDKGPVGPGRRPGQLQPEFRRAFFLGHVLL